MAKYQFKDPEGKVHLFEGPAGLTQSDVDLYARNFFAPAAKAPAAVAPPEPKGQTGFIPSIMRGGRGIASLATDVGPAMLGKLIGAEDYARRQMQEAAEYQKETERLYPAEVPSYKDIKGVGDAVTYIKEAIGEAIPSIIPSLLTGGAAAVVARPATAAAMQAAERVAAQEVARAAAKNRLTAETLEGIKKTALDAGVKEAQKIALKYEIGGALAGSAVQNIPDVYQNIYEETGKQDIGAALVAGSFNAVLDAITPINILRKADISGVARDALIGAWYKRAGVGALKGFATEGATEALQEMSSAAAEKFVDQNKQFFSEKNFERFINAGLKGGFGGAGITAATDVAFGRAEPKAPPAAGEIETPDVGQEIPGRAPETPPTKLSAQELTAKQAEFATRQSEIDALEAKGDQRTRGENIKLAKQKKKNDVLKAEIDAATATATQGAQDVGAFVEGAGRTGIQISAQPPAAGVAEGVAGTQPGGVGDIGAGAPATPPGAGGTQTTVTPPGAPTPPPPPKPPAPPTPPTPPAGPRTEAGKNAQADIDFLDSLFGEDGLPSAGTARRTKAQIEQDRLVDEYAKRYGLTRNEGETSRELAARIKQAALLEQEVTEKPMGALEPTEIAGQQLKEEQKYLPPQEQRDLYEETREAYNESAEEDEKLPAFRELTDDERRVYFQNNINRNTIVEHDQAAIALSDYLQKKRSESRAAAPEERAAEVSKVRAQESYTRERDAFSRRSGLFYNFPAWNTLSEESKRLFTQLNKTDSAAEQFLAFNAVKKQVQKELAQKQTRGDVSAEEATIKEQQIQQARREREEQPAGKGALLPDDIQKKLFDGDVEGVLDYLSSSAKGILPRPKNETYFSALMRAYDRTLRGERKKVTAEVFKNLATKLLSVRSGPMREFALNVNVVYDENMVFDEVGRYDADTNTIFIGPNGLDEATILHELTHAATVKIIHQFYLDPSKLDESTRRAVEHLINVAALAKSRIGSKYPNAFENMYEFIAYAMTDMDFQYELSRIQLEPAARATKEEVELSAAVRESRELGRFDYDAMFKTAWDYFTDTLAQLYKLFTPSKVRTPILVPVEVIDPKTGRVVVRSGVTKKTDEQLREEEAKLSAAKARKKKAEAVESEEEIAEKEKPAETRTRAEIAREFKPEEAAFDTTEAAEKDLSEMGYRPTKEQIEKEKRLTSKGGITNLKREILTEPGYKGNLLLETAAAFQFLLAAPEGNIRQLAGKKGIGASLAATAPKTVQAPPVPPVQQKTEDDFRSEVTLKPRGAKAIIRNLFTKDGYNWLATSFQNDRRIIKRLTERAELFRALKRVGQGLNDVYGQISRSTGMAVDLYARHISPLAKAVDAAVERYAQAAGRTIEEALADLHLILEARHEPERREVLFLRNVPLDKQTKYTVAGFTDAQGNPLALSPYAWREKVLEILSQPSGLPEQQREQRNKALRQLIDAFVFTTDANGNRVANMQYMDKSIDPKLLAAKTDINNADYNVIANRSPAEVKRIKDLFDKPALANEINAVVDAVQAVQKKTAALNAASHYWSEPVQNIVDFYGYQNYIPFKGKPGRTQHDEVLNLDSQRIGGELQEGQDTFEGRQSESENPLLQTLADGAAAAMRAGRRDLTLAIKNAINDKIVRGEKVGTIRFEDRYLKGEKKAEFGGPNKIFHYNNDGTIEVYQINDKNQSEAIRRTWRQSSPILDFVNGFTSGLGQVHTRFNPAFAPMNFVRDTLTNAGIISAELGPVVAGRLITAVSADVAQGGMYRAGNLLSLYEKGKFKEIQRLAGGTKPYKDLNEQEKYYRDIMDYIQLGGRVSYLQGIAAKGALDSLVKEVGRSGILKTKDQITGFFDAYNDIFEIAARTSTYRVLKDEFVARGMSDEEAKAKAVEYSKNLANFEQVGKYGKAMGALFMFFRPAATGAVRAIDALAPALGFDEAAFRAEAEAEAKAGVKGRTKQDIDNAVAAMKEKQRAARITTLGLAGMGVATFMIAMMLSGDDDEGRNRVATDDMARWTRYARFPIPGSDKFLQIPWGFGPGAFAAAGAQVAGAVMGRATLGDALSNIVTIGLDSFVPLPFSRISPLDNFPAFALDSVTPSAARPFFEYVMNIDGLGREIYNNRQSRYGDAYTGGDNIPEMYKMATRALFDATTGEVDISPNTLYFFASNYLDGWAKMLSTGVNIGALVLSDKQFDAKTDTLLLSSFIGGKSNVDAREFSRAENEIKGYERQINSLKNKPELLDRFMENNEYKYALVEAYNHEVNGPLRLMREAANKVRADTSLSIGERKAQLEEIVKIQNTIKRQILETFEEIKENTK